MRVPQGLVCRPGSCGSRGSVQVDEPDRGGQIPPNRPDERERHAATAAGRGNNTATTTRHSAWNAGDGKPPQKPLTAFEQPTTAEGTQKTGERPPAAAEAA